MASVPTEEVHRDRDESRPRKSALHSREATARQRLRPPGTLPRAPPIFRHEIAAARRLSTAQLTEDAKLGMQTPRRRRISWAVAASAIAHLALLVVVLLQRPVLLLPPAEPAGPPEAIIPILLLPRAPPPAAGGAARPSELRLHRRPPRPVEGPLPVTPLSAEPAPARPSERPSGPTVQEPAAPAPVGPPGPDLRLSLRHGAAGCTNAGAVGMSRAERERCDEQLGRGVATAPYLPAAIAPRIRAYYDAVAEAKRADPQPVRPPGIESSFGDPIPRPSSGHPPAIGCQMFFGPGARPNPRPHALTLGPCFIEPPKGPLTPEVDVPPP